MVKVTQGDRDAGMHLLSTSWIDIPIDDVFAQAFATYRQSIIEECARVAEELEDKFSTDSMDFLNASETDLADGLMYKSMGARSSATAIRKLKGE